jgi:hypothetical protein
VYLTDKGFAPVMVVFYSPNGLPNLQWRIELYSQNSMRYGCFGTSIEEAEGKVKDAIKQRIACDQALLAELG